MQYYTTKEIITKHHFTPDFLNKCLNRLQQVFQGHITRGNKNARLFSSEAMNIFDLISQKKQDGQSITEIEAFLLQGQNSVKQDIILPGEHGSTAAITYQNSLMEKLLEEKDKRLRLQAEKDEIIRNLEKEKSALEGGLKLLTDGRSPETVKAELKAEQDRQIWIIAEKDEIIQAEEKKRILISEKIRQLQSLSITQWWKRKKLLKEISALIEPEL